MLRRYFLAIGAALYSGNLRAKPISRPQKALDGFAEHMDVSQRFLKPLNKARKKQGCAPLEITCDSMLDASVIIDEWNDKGLENLPAFDEAMPDTAALTADHVRDEEDALDVWLGNRKYLHQILNPNFRHFAVIKAKFPQSPKDTIYVMALS